MKSLGVWAGQEGSSDDKMLSAWNTVLGYRPAKAQSEPLPMDATDTVDTPGLYGVFDLPLYEMPGRLKTTSSLVDIVDDVEIPVDMADLIAKHKAGNYNDLPGAFGFNGQTEIPVTMDINISKKANGKLLLVKHLQFIRQEKTQVVVRGLVKGADKLQGHGSQNRF